MAVKGQKFELDLEAENWQFNVRDNVETMSPVNVVKEIQERDIDAIPAAPSMKSSRTGFPEHRPRKNRSVFREQKTAQPAQHPGPSDRAILHHAAKKHGVDMTAASQKADIDAENRARVNNMTLEEIEEARSELMAQINPDALRKFLQRANVDEDSEKQEQQWQRHEAQEMSSAETSAKPASSQADEPAENAGYNMSNPPLSQNSTVHFPGPPRKKADYKPLDPNSESFLKDLREHYFPDLPHDPNALAWLQDPTETENKESAYNPDRTGFAPSALRFNFNGALITPSESLDIPTSKGLHHHGEAPSSAGYTIPELGLLSRSTLANQRCVAYQVIGRILYRLGRGDFGPRGGEITEGLWTCIERERVLEVVMAEANRDKGHVSAKAFATEALWLWRRGGGGDRGILKEGERRAT